MLKSLQDTFCTAKALTNGTTESSVTTYSTDILDFGAHGDDILYKLFLIIQCTTAMASVSEKPCGVSIYWQTSAAEAMSNPVETLLTPTALADADLTAKAFVIKNAPLPKNLLRYNRLKFVLIPDDPGGTETYPTTPPAFTAFLTDNRIEPLA
jgi:hypothetical protein